MEENMWGGVLNNVTKKLEFEYGRDSKKVRKKNI